MSSSRQVFVTTLAYILAGPILAIILGLLLLTKPSLTYFTAMTGLIGLFLMFWFLHGFIYTKQAKWDTRIVRLNGSPDETKNLLTKTTKKGNQIHVILLKCFEKEDVTYSQTDLIECPQRKMRIEESDRTTTHPRGGLSRSQIVDEYIEALKDHGIIQIVSHGHEVRYDLTQKGKEFKRIAEWYFPSRNILFCLRNILRLQPRTASSVSYVKDRFQ